MKANDGAGAGSSADVEVYDIAYDEAREVAYTVCQNIFVDVGWNKDGNQVRATNHNLLLGDTICLIRPVMYQGECGDVGVAFDVQSMGIGVNGSMVPGYVTGKFQNELHLYAKENGIATKRLKNGRQTRCRGFVSRIADGIPCTREGFITYLGAKGSVQTYEGVWVDEKSQYTLGIIYDGNDPVYHYKAFVLDSTRPGWHPGDVKIRFNFLKRKEVCPSRYADVHKEESGVLWLATRNILASKDDEHVLTKVYPRDEGVKGGGTCWLIDPAGYFVTNHHVVEDANKLFIRMPGKDEVRAWVVAQDDKTDLAILKAQADMTAHTPLPVMLDDYAEVGDDVYIMGYPYMFSVGETCKFNEGVISSLTGVRDSMVNYQVSASINSGNSGGPAFTRDGNVVGVSVSSWVQGHSEGMHYVVKSTYLRPFVEMLGLKVRRPRYNARLEPAEIYRQYMNSVFIVIQK